MKWPVLGGVLASDPSQEASELDSDAFSETKISQAAWRRMSAIRPQVFLVDRRVERLGCSSGPAGAPRGAPAAEWPADRMGFIGFHCFSKAQRASPLSRRGGVTWRVRQPLRGGALSARVIRHPVVSAWASA